MKLFKSIALLGLILIGTQSAQSSTGVTDVLQPILDFFKGSKYNGFAIGAGLLAGYFVAPEIVTKPLDNTIHKISHPKLIEAWNHNHVKLARNILRGTLAVGAGAWIINQWC